MTSTLLDIKMANGVVPVTFSQTGGFAATLWHYRESWAICYPKRL